LLLAAAGVVALVAHMMLLVEVRAVVVAEVLDIHLLPFALLT
jgi:hypothetical protein